MKNKTLINIGIAFSVLFSVSLLRFLCVKYIPNDPVSPFVIYAVYIVLIAVWIKSLKTRMIQRYMLYCIRIECYVMIFWMTIRLLQETVFYKNIHLMRVSGYFIILPTMATVIFGFFASYGLGENEEYKNRGKKEKFILISGCVLVALMLTNEYHHIVFRVLPGEEENLYFHMNYGIVVIILFGTALVIARIVVIYRKTRNVSGSKIRRVLPVLAGCSLPLVVLRGMLSSFLIEEIIELTAKFFFFEAIMWESCIYAGLVPVNTQYGMVFERSTVGMRIIDRHGNTRYASRNARELSDEDILTLIRTGELLADKDSPVYAQEISDGYLIYHNDISAINGMLKELNAHSIRLNQESVLLAEEIRSSSEQASIEAKNRIYNTLSTEMDEKLKMMEKTIDESSGNDRQAQLKKLCILGTYIKRRCNLRLGYQDEEHVKSDDFYLSLMDISSCLKEMDIDCKLVWEPETEFLAATVLKTMDELEDKLEANGFEVKLVEITVRHKPEIEVIPI